MTNSEVVNAWNEAFFARKTEEFTHLMSEDFSFTGPAPEPLNKEAYIGMMDSLLNAFPDLSNDMKITSDSGKKVGGSLQIAGTHTGAFDLSAMNMAIIPPTGKAVRLPREQFSITVRDGQISRFDVDVPEDGGLKGILTQLGVDMPG